jgi:hypothetical protein
MASSNQGKDQDNKGNQGGSASQGSSKQSATQGSSKQSDTSTRGFASMDPERQREIAAEGGRAAHEKGTAHEFTSEEARRAGSMSHKNDQGSSQSSTGGSGSRGGSSGGNQGSSSGGSRSGGSDKR